MFHYCKCQNNLCGLCYGQCKSTYQRDIGAGKINETDCPGYLAPGQAGYEKYPIVTQGDAVISLR
jgi:hypothetical protein